MPGTHSFLKVAGLAFALAASLMWPAAAREPAGFLRDQNGTRFRISSIGTPVVLTFVSAHCVDACPLINAQFAQMQEGLRRSRVPVRLLTLSLDPAHDAPADMRRIAHVFGADPHFWIVGSGPAGLLRNLMQRYRVTSSRGNREYDDVHTTFVYLLDAHGRFVKTMLASTNLSSDLFAELQRDWDRLEI